MCLLSLTTYKKLASKKYSALRKDTGAKKGARGPVRVTKGYWYCVIAGWAGWSQVWGVSLPL